MKSFKDFKITPKYNAFTGEKIAIDKVLNIEITVFGYKIEPSKKKAGSNFLTLHIEFKKEHRVVFTGATILQQLIELVPKDDFPFTTTIIKNNEHLEFT